MKKKIVTGFSVAIILAFLFACTDKDETPPVITIKQNTEAYNRLAQYSLAAWTDPGATAVDETDGELDVTVTGTANVNSAGDYNIIYSATDLSGNQTSASRIVTIDGAMFMEDAYTVSDFNYMDSLNFVYNDTLQPDGNNMIRCRNFAGLAGANVKGTFTGTTLTVPQQAIVCGTPPVSRTFSGSGTYSNNFASFRLDYTIVTPDTIITGHGMYVRN